MANIRLDAGPFAGEQTVPAVENEEIASLRLLDCYGRL